MTETLLSGNPDYSPIIDLTNLTLSRRFRLDTCPVIAAVSITGISTPSAGAWVPDESFIVNFCNFSGGGNYLWPLTTSDNKAFIVNTKGINNSANIAQYYMTANGTATTISISGTPLKILGTTTSGPYIEKFTLTNNRATYAGALQGFYKVSALSTLSGGANDLASLYVAANGSIVASSKNSSTLNSGTGRAENVSCQAIVSLNPGNYIEMFIANDTDTTSITVVDLNVIIERLN
jgi:hypothetical protein